MNALVEETLRIARGEVGVREVGTNRGARVGEYQKLAGLPTGVPWCACFVYACCEWAAQSLNTTNPFPRTGWCPHIANWAAEEKVLMTAPAPGDVFLRYGKTAGVYRAHHTGFVAGVSGSTFSTVEGNSNPSGGREGIGVFSITRQSNGPYKFVRWGHFAEPVGRFTLVAGGKERFPMLVVGGRSMVPIAAWAKLLGFALEWNQNAQAPLFDGKEVPVELSEVGGVQAAPLRELAAWSGLKVEVDAAARRVTISR